MDRYVLGMTFIRLLSGSIEITAALLMLRSGDLNTAFRINALLGLTGPLIFLSASAVGLLGLAGKLSIGRFVVVLGGVFLILIGVR
ncbi:MAG: YqhV family protein [Bacillota bacterium]